MKFLKELKRSQMQVWSVGVSENIFHSPLLQKFSSAPVRYFNNGIELITALRENTRGRLAILLNLCLPVLDGLGVIRLLQQEGWIDKHEFILMAPSLPDQELAQLQAWQVQVLPGSRVA